MNIRAIIISRYLLRTTRAHNRCDPASFDPLAKKWKLNGRYIMSKDNTRPAWPFQHITTMTAALLDRFTHRCHIFEINGESFRFRESAKAAKEKKAKGN